jgi:hypothetical protein
VDGTGSGSCPVAVSDVSEVEAPINRRLKYLISLKIKMDVLKNVEDVRWMELVQGCVQFWALA